MPLEKRPISRVGITGAGGLVGRMLVDGLPDKYLLTLFDKVDLGDPKRTVEKAVKADLSKEEEVEGKFEGLDAVIHLAALAGRPAPWRGVLSDNVEATYNVVEEARRAGVRRVVFASTHHVQNYAVGRTNDDKTLDPAFVESGWRVKTTDPVAPDSLYGVSKCFGEDLGRYYSRFHGLEFVAVRIGSVAPQDPREYLKYIVLENPANEAYYRALFFSQRDCVDLFVKTLEVDTDFLVVYGASNNRHPIFDMAETERVLGYRPRDTEEAYFKAIVPDPIDSPPPASSDRKRAS